MVAGDFAEAGVAAEADRVVDLAGAEVLDPGGVAVLDPAVVVGSPAVVVDAPRLAVHRHLVDHRRLPRAPQVQVLDHLIQSPAARGRISAAAMLVIAAARLCNPAHAPAAGRVAVQLPIALLNCRVTGPARVLGPGRVSVLERELEVDPVAARASQLYQQVARVLQTGPGLDRASVIVQESDKGAQTGLRNYPHDCRDWGRRGSVRSCPIRAPASRIAWPIGQERWKIGVPT